MRIRRYTDEERWRGVGAWRLVYGRRKTGKSFFVRNFTEWDRYYFVLARNEILDTESGKKISRDVFLTELKYVLGKERIVVDEFHRLGREFMDWLHALGKKGELTLITSSLFVAKRVFEPNAPLLGLVDEFPLGLISPVDILRNIGGDITLGTFLRDPWVIEENVSLSTILSKVGNHVNGIVAEIFYENERKPTDVYEGTMKAVASGWKRLTDIYYYIRNKGVRVSQPSVLEKYLIVLSEVGILDRVKVWGRGGYAYIHSSPIFDLHFYLKDRYGFPELPLGTNTIKEELEKKLPFYIEHFVRLFFSQLFSLSPGMYIKKEKEVDIALGRKRIEILGEVKWKDDVTVQDVRRVEKKLEEVERTLGRVRKKILFVKDASNVPETELEVWDVERMVRESREVL